MRQKDRRNRVIFSIVSLVIVLTMGLSTVATLAPTRHHANVCSNCDAVSDAYGYAGLWMRRGLLASTVQTRRVREWVRYRLPALLSKGGSP